MPGSAVPPRRRFCRETTVRLPACSRRPRRSAASLPRGRRRTKRKRRSPRKTRKRPSPAQRGRRRGISQLDVDAAQPDLRGRRVRVLRGVMLAGALCLARAADAPTAAQLLAKADSLRLLSYPQFVAVLGTIESRSGELQPRERDY